MPGRIRSIKPEFFTSPDTGRASIRARLFYVALWCWADDYGIGETNFNMLAGFAFPEGDQIERKELPSLCKEVAEAYGTMFYTVRGRHYYSIPTWDEHQRTQRKAAAKYPTPDHPEAAPDLRVYGETGPSAPMQGTSASTQGSDEDGTGEREQGKGEQGNSARSARGARKAPAKRLPEDWAPTDAHRKKAAELGVDVTLEADRFRLHAEANDRRAVRWDAAFSMWLSKATPPLPGMGARGNANDRRVQDTAALLNRAPWEGAMLTTDDWRAERERTAHGHPNHPTLDTQGALEA